MEVIVTVIKLFREIPICQHKQKSQNEYKTKKPLMLAHQGLLIFKNELS